MPKQTKITKALQTNRVLEAFKKVQNGMTIKDACLETGISDDAYRDWLVSNEEAILAIQELVNRVSMLELAEIIAARRKLISSIIADAINTDDPYLRLQTEKRLDDLQKNLEVRIVPNKDEKENTDVLFLEGIKRHKAANVSIQTKEDGSVQVNVEPNQSRIIDISED